MADYIIISPSDNVGVALRPLLKGTAVTYEVSGQNAVLTGNIPAGHKFALRDLSAGENVIKYGQPIGHLQEDVPAGSPVDHNNLKSNLSGILEYRYEPSPVPVPKTVTPRTFQGFRRPDGQVGTRNEIWIIPTVGCVNGTVQRLAELFSREMSEEASIAEGNISSVVAFTHNYGCSQLGEDHENTRRILRNMVHHPNAGGVLVVGLGCENNQLSSFREMLGEVDGSRVKFMETQKVEGDEIEYGLELLREIRSTAIRCVREPVPVSELKIGLKCGGSDGLSGITANPLLGAFSDWLVSQGGTAVLTEVPEMFGAEILLMNRCEDESVFCQTVDMINGFKEYYIRNGQPVYENPSPGNKEGGISTLEEKSLGCTQKSGTSAVRGVIPYGGVVEKKGLNLLSAPGNDLVASTALAAAGCQMVLFTTGRGTPFGTFVPTLKVSSNTPLALRKPSWTDFDAGRLTGDMSMPELSEEFIEKVLSVASGEQTCCEKNGCRDIAIFKSGVTL